MARKGRPEEKSINSSSAEEEEGASSAKGSGSESEGPALLATKKVVDSSSDEAGSETGSGSDSDSDSDLPPPAGEGMKPDPSIKPISSKPMDEAPPKNPKSSRKAVIPSSPLPAKPAAGGKRPAEEGEQKEGKKGKKNEGSIGEDSKNKLFQRIWSEDDEIVILEGMIDYAEKKGADPFTDLNAFYNFIKKSLHVDVNKAQLSAKARRLKQKYENNLVREKQGKVRSFSNPHEKRAYELSKKVWASASAGASASDMGNGNGEGSSAGVKSKSKSTVKVNGTTKNAKGKMNSKSVANGIDAHKEVSTVATEQNGEKSLPFHIGLVGVPFTEEAFMKNGWELIADSKRAELADQWKELRLQEMELYLKRVELIQTQTKLVLDEMKAANK